MADAVSLRASILGNEIVKVDDIPWTQGTTVLAAMEAVYNSGKAPNFTFLIGYYGTDLGYLLHEVNKTGDQPRVYWLVAVNGETMHTGLDKVELKAGDAVSLTLSYFRGADARKNPPLAAKLARARLNPSLEAKL